MFPAKKTAKPKQQATVESDHLAPHTSVNDGLSRSSSLSDRLKSSWKGGVSSLMKRSQDNVRAEALAKARRSRETNARADADAGSVSTSSNAVTKGKEPMELPASSKHRKQTADSKETDDYSPVDPAYSPNRKKFRTSQSPPPVPSKSPLPQQTSFFDSNSYDEDESPVLQRASSVRIGKPTLVRHQSNAAASQAVRHEQSPAPPAGLAEDNTATHGSPVSSLAMASQTATVQDADVEPSSQVSSSWGQDPEDALARLEGTSISTPQFATKPLPLTPGSPPPFARFSAQPQVASPISYTAFPTPPHPTPASTASDTVASSHISGAPAPSVLTVSSIQQPSLPFPTPLSPLSALHSNPVSPTTACAAAALNVIPRLNRALSAPTHPGTHNPNRRVTIRPSDLVIVHSDHDHRLFRESVVTTPYPEKGATSDSRGSGVEGRVGRSRSLGVAIGRGPHGSRSGDETGRLGVRKGTINRLSDIPDEASHRDVIDAEERPVSHLEHPSHGEEDAGSSIRHDRGGSDSARQQHVQLVDPPMSPHGPGDRDRFPSLSSSESLFLVLSIAGHPYLSTTVEVEVPPNALAIASSPNLNTHQSTSLSPHEPSANTSTHKSLFRSLRTHTLPRQQNRLSKPPPPSSSSSSTSDPQTLPFDDHHLFTHLRRSYLHLIHHPLPLLLVSPTRTLSTLASATPDMHALDAPSFLAHLRNPKLGAGRRGWLLWLRNQQAVRKRASSLFSAAPGITATGKGGGGGGDGGEVVGSPTGSTLSAGATGQMYPRMPFQRSEVRDGPPRVVLGYRFSWGVIAGAVLGWLVVGAVVVVVWALCGLPGGKVGGNGGGGMGSAGLLVVGGDVTEEGIGIGVVRFAGNGEEGTGEWRVDSQKRVLTALVMGGGVSAAGLVLTALWVLGGWILL